MQRFLEYLKGVAYVEGLAAAHDPVVRRLRADRVGPADRTGIVSLLGGSGRDRDHEGREEDESYLHVGVRSRECWIASIYRTHSKLLVEELITLSNP